MKARHLERWRASLQRSEPLLLGVTGFAVGVAAWEGLARAGYLKPVLFSSPSAVAQTAWRLAQSGLWGDVRITLIEFGLGFLLGSLAGIVLGLVAGTSRRAAAVLDPWIGILYVAPIVALTPLFILWFGIGINFKVFVVFLVTVFPVALNVRTGVATGESKFRRMAFSFGVPPAKLLLTVILPGAVPYILTGMRQAMGRALVGVVVAELIASNQGIGFLISLGGATFNTPQVMFGIALLALLGILLGQVFGAFERHFDRWRG
jgi:ABC-type nitrate/sulfonate/bicarbonate transport system permease component